MTRVLSTYGAFKLAFLPIDVLTGFLPAFESALRHGVDISRLDGAAASTDENGHFAVGTRLADRVALLENEVKDYRRRTTVARGMSTGSITLREAEEYRDRARALEAEADRIEEQIERLRAEAAAPVRMPPSFASEVDFLLDGARAIATSTDRVDAKTAEAVRALLADFRITVTSSADLVASAAVLLPAEGTVYRLGPVRWPIQRCTLTPALVWAAREAAGEAWPEPVQPPRPPERKSFPSHKIWMRNKLNALDERNELQSRLVDAGYGRASASALLDSVLPALPYAALAAVKPGAALDLEDRWLDPVWLEHLKQTYLPLATARDHSYPQPHAQAVIDIVHGSGGELEQRALMELLGPAWESTRNRCFQARTVHLPASLSPRVTPVHRDGGKWVHKRMLRSRECFACGSREIISVRAPEIPGWLICGCGALPGVTDLPDAERLRSVRVPSDYLLLKVPRLVWIAELRHEGAPGPFVSSVTSAGCVSASEEQLTRRGAPRR